MVQIHNLAKSFGARTLFRNVNWSLDPGERVGLVGPNGTGKTTLLKILSGQEPADEGNVVAARDLRIGYLAQDVRVEARGSVLRHAMSGCTEALAAKERLEATTAALGQASGDAIEPATAAQAEALEAFEREGGYDLEARARAILVGLGFRSDQLDTDLHTLSGGWTMRAELARLLLAKPGLLLLDEPTNHLDLESIDWLERFLDDYDGTWVVVSHDRYFLNRMVDRIAELSSHGLLVFEGDYDDYVSAREELDARLESEAIHREKKMAEVQGFVDRFRAKASKARQAQSRVKLLERMKKKAQDAPRARGAQRGIALNLPPPPRSGDIVLEARDLAKHYGDQVVHAGLDFTLRRGDRVALVGPNGAGKSTLLKMMAGVEEPSAGECRMGHNVSRYYFAQHQSDSLASDATPLEALREVMPLESESRVRGVLGAFLFTGDDVDKKIRVLSGGERARVVLAQMLARPANLLLLDEPTNHLDLQARAVLEAALTSFPGTVVVVSHDRYFLNHLATSILEIHPGGAVTHFLGDYDYYLWKKSGADEQEPTVPVETHAREAGNYESRKRAKRERQKLERAASELEARIGDLESRIAEIDALMSEAADDSGRLTELHQERVRHDATLVELYSSWERSQSALEAVLETSP